MNQRIVEELSQAIYKSMPRFATGEQKVTVDLAARAILVRHIDKCNAEANELDEIIDRLYDELAELHSTIRESAERREGEVYQKGVSKCSL